MQAERTRGWWNFSLRTLFVAVTVTAIGCCYVGYQLNIIRARKALLSELTSAGFAVTTAEEASQAMQAMRPADQPDPSVPLMRSWLGDEPIQTIGYYPHQRPDGKKLRRITQTIPEADLIEFAPPLEPCHPGCFPHSTLVETAAGPRRIEAIAVGDLVISISPAGERVSLPVTSIFRTSNRIWIVETDQGTLRTTETQPLYTQLAAVVEAGKLEVGDVILTGQGHAARVLRIQKTTEITPVVNLVLGNRESFIAGGYLARSKPPREEIHAHHP